MYSPPFTERGNEMNFSLMLQNIDRRQRFDLNFVLRMKFFILLRIIINCLFLNKYIDRRQTTLFQRLRFSCCWRLWYTLYITFSLHFKHIFLPIYDIRNKFRWSMDVRFYQAHDQTIGCSFPWSKFPLQ